MKLTKNLPEKSTGTNYKKSKLLQTSDGNSVECQHSKKNSKVKCDACKFYIGEKKLKKNIKNLIFVLLTIIQNIS